MDTPQAICLHTVPGQPPTLGQVVIRSKIVIDNKVLEQVNTFTYLRCKIHTKRKRT
jgi:hypothetical protein